MTLIACGRTHVNDTAERITRVMRENEGFRTDGGCGFEFDTDNAIQVARLYRCVECGRWLCKPCILAHFEESRHDDERPVAPPSAQPESGAVESTPERRLPHTPSASGGNTSQLDADPLVGLMPAVPRRSAYPLGRRGPGASPA